MKEYGLEKKVTLEVLATNELVAEKLGSGEADIVILPEPKASAAILTAKQQGNTYSISLNLSDEWSEVSSRPLTMGCIIVSNKFLRSNEKAVKSFLREYKASIEYVGNKANHESAAQMIVDAKILPKLPIAKSALNNLYGSIVYIDGDAMEDTLESFYNAIGIALPDDDFYYDD
jgi:NitT/TauT family transport system substrate-binding protein